MIYCLAIAIAMLFGLRGTYISAEDVRAVDLQTDEVLVEVDETDWENASFRYALQDGYLS
ncbi:hypothetical protein LSUB1_G005697 [Lachnellula subtilissima]|uniref:Uncharacterized protein n=1 Tax=Lachnellula subtilissima TaxID=602034 RepID=A0A8H8U9D5_9HELO|nr:hypothetical protein LSUB1_G005697 [Lachnellula subtilissima]